MSLPEKSAWNLGNVTAFAVAVWWAMVYKQAEERRSISFWSPAPAREELRLTNEAD